MQHRTVAFVLALVLVAAGGGAVASADSGGADADEAAEAADEHLVTVNVEVVTRNGDPISGAEVAVEWDGGEADAGTTRSNGRTLVDVPENGTVRVTATHEGFIRNIPAEFQDVSGDDVLQVTMYPRSSSAFSVVDGDGDSVENAQVRVQKVGQSSAAASGRTNPNGVYDAPDVEAGEYRVVVSKAGHYSVGTRVELGSGDSNNRIEFPQGEERLRVQVRDPVLDEPLQASVSITNDGEQIASSTTDQEGRRSILLGVNDGYEYRVENEGYDPVEGSFRMQEQERTLRINMTRRPALTIDPDNQQIVVGERLRLVVRDEYDRPAEGVTVSVGGEEATETNGEGVARVEIPTEGNVTVEAERDGVTAESVTVSGITAAEADEDEDGDEEPEPEPDPEPSENETDDNATDGDEEDDGPDAIPGFGVPAALLAALLAAAAVARRR